MTSFTYLRFGSCFVLSLSLSLGTAACGGDDSGSGTGGGSGGTGASSSGGTSGGGTSSGGTSSGGTAGSASGGTSAGGTSTGGVGGGGPGLSSKYPGDVGIENDPDVVWAENFEEGSTGSLLARYDDTQSDGLSLDADVPPASSGTASGKLTANGAGPDSVGLYKRLDPGHAELFVRYYAKYGSGAEWHHTGVGLGGYNPPSNWPQGGAGLKPNGDDRFSVRFEPMGSSPDPRLDFYAYWMKMHSWMDQPSGDQAYYGNTLVHQSSVAVADDAWMCVEFQVEVNPDPSSGAGAELGLWLNDQSIVQFTDSAPTGCWIKDKFCSQSGPVANDPDCTDYPGLCTTPYVPLDLQLRSTAALDLNYLWILNYITSGGDGSVWYDDLVVAKSYVGCIQ